MIKNLLILIFSFITSASFSQVKMIFDTDIGGDADDLGALAMLNHFVDRGECELLAVMSWSTEKYAVPAIDAVNRYYGNPDIPIGTRKGEVSHIKSQYNKPLADHFPYQLTYEDVPDATKLYRKILSEQSDNSVVIVTVGPLKNIQNLLQSVPDDISNLSGKDLIRKKVKEFVIMGGKFPEGEGEWNFDGNMPGVTKFVLEHLNVPVVFSGFELGVQVKTGKIFNQLDKNTPLYIGYYHFSKNAPWMKKYFEGEILDNSSYDQTAVLYAVRGGVGKYWEKITNGYCKADDKGNNQWVKGNKHDHAYLKLITDPEAVAQVIESIMLGKF